MKKNRWHIFLVLILAVIMTGCFDQSNSNKDGTVTTQESDKTSDGQKDEAETSEYEMTIGETTEENMTADKEDTTTENVEVTTEEATTEREEATSEEEKEIILDESKAVKVWTTASTLNLRKAPNTSSEVLKVLKYGTELKKYEEKDGWALVKYGDAVGYVSIKYIAKEKPAEPTTQKEQETTTSKVEAIPGQHRNPNSAVVVIDPGHQRKGDSTKEPNGPGSSEMKARVTYGTTGKATGVAEYVLNLDIAMKLRTELQNRGYTVYMTRTSHDVNMSNKERAEYGNSVGADVAVRIHANSADSSSVRGAETLAPSSGNPYVGHLAKASQSLSKYVINEYCKATGFKNRGVKTNDTMTGINWSEIPVTIIELGFMSSPEEDELMQDANMQNNMVQGIANGLDAYFGF